MSAIQKQQLLSWCLVMGATGPGYCRDPSTLREPLVWQLPGNLTLAAVRQFLIKIQLPHTYTRGSPRAEYDRAFTVGTVNIFLVKDPTLRYGGPARMSHWQMGPLQFRCIRGRSLNILSEQNLGLQALISALTFIVWDWFIRRASGAWFKHWVFILL